MAADVMDRTTPRVIWTGHPPPLEQVAGQIRTSTGVTYGRPYVAAPDPSLGEWLAGEAERPSPAPQQHLNLPNRLLKWLEAQTDGFLPPFPFLAELLNPSLAGNIHASNRVIHALEALEARGAVKVWWGKNHGAKGGCAVRVVVTGHVLRNRFAPVGVAP